MPMCCIVQCSSRKNKNQPQLTFHRLPRNELRRQQWINIIGIENINRHKECYICSLHFHESSFNRTLDVVRLRDNAVPSTSLLINKNASSLSDQETTPQLLTQPVLRLHKINDNAVSSTSQLLARRYPVRNSTSLSAQETPQPSTQPALQLHKINNNAIPSTSQVTNKNACTSSDQETTQPTLQLYKLNCDKLTDKLEKLFFTESGNFLQTQSSARLAPLSNVEIGIREVRSKEAFKKLSLTCTLQRRKIKNLNEKVRKQNKRIVLLKHIIKELKKKNRVNNE